MTILVTRPEPGASRTVAALESGGLAALSCPLFDVTASGAARPSGKFAALLVTSGHGAAGLTPTLADLPANLPVFAVGDRTAEAMTANGFSNVTSASGDQKALTRLVLAKLPQRYRVLLATGEDHKDGLPAAFADAGHEIALWIRYRAEPVAALPDAARAALAAGSIGKVLHYSRRASETFVALAAKSGLLPVVQPLQHLALSADVAEPLTAAGFGHVAVAGQPDEEHMLALLTARDVATVVEAPPTAAPQQAAIMPPSSGRTIPRSRKAPLVAKDELQDVAEASQTLQPEPASLATAIDAGKIAEAASVPAAGMQPEPVQTVRDAARQTIPPTVINRGFGMASVLAISLASGVTGAGLVGFLAPLLGQTAASPPPPAIADMSSRLSKLETARPASGGPEMQAAINAAVQNAVQSANPPVQPQLREQISGLERRISELAARPQGTSSAPEAAAQTTAAITDLRSKLAAAEQATQAMAPRLEEIEKLARMVGAPSGSAAGAAKLIVADRLARALSEGRPFAPEMTALTALGAAAEPMRVLGAMAAGGAPAMATISAEFRKLRPVFAAEPASPDAPWSERLLKLTDGLVRVRSTGAVQGASPAAVASRIDQALQRGDSAAAAAAFADLPEPARRAGEAWIVAVRERASADQAVKTITDDAIKALSAAK